MLTCESNRVDLSSFSRGSVFFTREERTGKSSYRNPAHGTPPRESRDETTPWGLVACPYFPEGVRGKARLRIDHRIPLNSDESWLWWRAACTQQERTRVVRLCCK